MQSISRVLIDQGANIQKQIEKIKQFIDRVLYFPILCLTYQKSTFNAKEKFPSVISYICSITNLCLFSMAQKDCMLKSQNKITREKLHSV